LCVSKFYLLRNDQFAKVSLDASKYIAQKLRFPRRIRTNHEDKPGTLELTEFR
jgi:hypothetical protein